MKKPTQLETIENVVCAAANVKPKSLKTASKARNLVDARHTVWHLAYNLLELTYAEIAALYDRDYTAVSHGVRRMDGLPLISSLMTKLASEHPDCLKPVSREPGAGWKL